MPNRRAEPPAHPASCSGVHYATQAQPASLNGQHLFPIVIPSPAPRICSHFGLLQENEAKLMWKVTTRPLALVACDPVETEAGSLLVQSPRPQVPEALAFQHEPSLDGFSLRLGISASAS